MRIFMAVCALAQVAAVMPHHHHEASDALCINPFHCVETHAHVRDDAQDCSDGCGLHAFHNHGEAVAAMDHQCGDVCAGHFCMHNTTGHRHSPDGSDCRVSYLDLNPPTKDRVVIAAPVLELAYTYITSYPPLDIEKNCCDHCRSGDIMCCSVYEGTIALHSCYTAAALPARAPSVLV